MADGSLLVRRCLFAKCPVTTFYTLLISRAPVFARLRHGPKRECLAEAQNYLVDLLDYLEEKEAYSYFPGEREKCRLGQKVE